MGIPLLTLVAACGAATAPVRPLAAAPPPALMGTWQGALDTNPVTLRVFGYDDAGLRAEIEVNHPDGTERWSLMAEPTSATTLTLTSRGEGPVCEAQVDADVLVGTCAVPPGGRAQQWLAVRL